MQLTIQFDKVVPGGQALGRDSDGRVVFCDGVLPGETARVELFQSKKNFAQGRLLEVVSPSDHRSSPPREPHYLACSPWQGVDYDYQLELGKQMVLEAAGQQSVVLPEFEVQASPKQWGYRNKLDFALDGIPGAYSLAMHQRGSAGGLVHATHGCQLGSDQMNTLATGLVTAVNALPQIAAERIVVRQTTTGQFVLILVVPSGTKCDWSSLQQPECLLVVNSQLGPGKNPQQLYPKELVMLSEKLDGLVLDYPSNVFFQVNPPAFEAALSSILETVTHSRRADGNVLDLYGGVGAIGLSLSRAGYPTADNGTRLGLAYRSIHSASEDIAESLVAGASSIVVDPPRSGLDASLVEMLVQNGSDQLVYLSCNPITALRDIRLLEDRYQLSGFGAYDFYPQTPHFEVLATLTKR
jgi:23S rRNA (uracil1939-C5)-methyltransferase